MTTQLPLLDDESPQPEPKPARFRVSKAYMTESVFETDCIVDATRYASAVAMHTGKGLTVNRIYEEEDQGSRHIKVHRMFTIHAEQMDYRAVTPETSLIMKAIAHDLMANVDQIAPEFATEGPKR